MLSFLSSHSLPATAREVNDRVHGSYIDSSLSRTPPFVHPRHAPAVRRRALSRIYYHERYLLVVRTFTGHRRLVGVYDTPLERCHMRFIRREETGGA